jgi:hypothetical protein
MKPPRPKADPRKSAPKGAVERGDRNAQPPGPTGYAKGGTVRGMGAAAKGGKFGKNG